MVRRRLQLQRFLALSTRAQQYPVKHNGSYSSGSSKSASGFRRKSRTELKPNDSSSYSWNPLLSGKIGMNPAMSSPCHEAMYSGRWLWVSRRGWNALTIHQKHKVSEELVLIQQFTATQNWKNKINGYKGRIKSGPGRTHNPALIATTCTPNGMYCSAGKPTI
jgi:hypothetical protein